MEEADAMVETGGYSQLPAAAQQRIEQFDGGELATKLLLDAAERCASRARRLERRTEALRCAAQQRCPHAKVEHRDSGDYYSSYSLRYCRLCGQLLG